MPDLRLDRTEITTMGKHLFPWHNTFEDLDHPDKTDVCYSKALQTQGSVLIWQSLMIKHRALQAEVTGV